MEGKGLTIHLEPWDNREKIVAGEEVEKLMQHPGWEFVLASIRDYERVILNPVVGTAQESIEKYAHVTGEIKGLREVKQIAQGLVKVGKETEDRLRRLEEQRGVEA